MKKLFAYIFLLFALVSCNTSRFAYFASDGFIQGTTYHIVYEYNAALSSEINYQLHKFDTSLSAYIPQSTISKVNNNQIVTTTDTLFLRCLCRSLEISELTKGAFDITVSPIVNVWGFGFSKRQAVSQQMIDSLKQFIGYKKIRISGDSVIKDIPQLQLNANAIAQGLSCDYIAELFQRKGIDNYMVEIGGEVIARGVNSRGMPWRIGIDKPIDDSTASHRELQEIVALNGRSLCTSGNYRKFYVEDGVKYSHTINPKTGYPAKNKLLSASIMGTDCMSADAIATSCMVLGEEAAVELCDSLPEIEYYFIYTDDDGELQTKMSAGFADALIK